MSRSCLSSQLTIDTKGFTKLIPGDHHCAEPVGEGPPEEVQEQEGDGALPATVTLL